MKIKKMTDRQCLDTVAELMDTRVGITTLFVQDKETDLLTHQILNIQCGEENLVSNPQKLEVPLRVATAEEMGVTVN
jgi:hypothetical protein